MATAETSQYRVEAKSGRLYVMERQENLWVLVASMDPLDAAMLVVYGFNPRSPAVMAVIDEAEEQISETLGF